MAYGVKDVGPVARRDHNEDCAVVQHSKIGFPFQMAGSMVEGRGAVQNDPSHSIDYESGELEETTFSTLGFPDVQKSEAGQKKARAVAENVEDLFFWCLLRDRAASVYDDWAFPCS